VKAAMPPAAERIRRWNATSGGNLATTALMAINIAVFVVGVIASKGSSLGNNGRSSLLENGALYLPDIRRNEFWRLITSGFLHFGVVHLAFNMFALFQLGRALEPGLGRGRFVGVYLASLLSGSAMVLLMDRAGFQSGSLTAGASGAVFGLMGCLALGMRARGISVMRSGLGATLLINLFLTLQFGFSFGGHLGGFIGGAICGAILLSPRPVVSKQFTQLAPLLVGVASVVIAIAVSR
jgi:membrane associated rhomboid family serine protease